jgi:hypothetical protein
MNALYHYAYPNGYQFVTPASEIQIKVGFELLWGKQKAVERVPKLIGVWRYKKVKTKNK